jgi:hypothetical protein
MKIITQNTQLQILFISLLFFTTTVFAQVGIGLTAPLNAQFTVNQDAIFNESGGAFNFRVETDNNPNMLFINGTSNRIGINTATPASQLQFISTGVTGWITQWDNTTNNGGLGRFQHTLATNGSRVLMGSTNYNGTASQASSVIGLALNANTINPNPGNNPPGAIGVEGFNNNEDGIGVYGGIAFNGNYNGYAGYFNANVYLGGGLFGPSDKRLKRDINDFTALDKISRINPVTYYYDTQKFPGISEDNKLAYGFIAQEIEEIIPEMVKDSDIILNSNSVKSINLLDTRETAKFKTVNYLTMIPILTQGIKEQQQIIESQNDKIKSLEKKLADLEAKVNSLLEN